MGYLNIARVLIGRPPKVVSKHRDKDGYVWARDPEGFYFKAWNVGVENIENYSISSLKTVRVNVSTRDVPEDVRKALEADGAGFSAEDLARDALEEWSYQKFIPRSKSVFG